MKRLAGGIALALLVGFSSAPAQQSSGAKTHKGLEISVVSVERAASAALGDCPPGANTQRAMARAGEEFVIVTLGLKVLPSYSSAPVKRPVLTDRGGKSYNTAASFVDLGKAPESTCPFPYRVPTGTKLKSIQIDGVVFDLTPFDSKG